MDWGWFGFGFELEWAVALWGSAAVVGGGAGGVGVQGLGLVGPKA